MIGQVIPFVGYFTIMDTFITLSFVLLSITVAIHFFTQALTTTTEEYPLNLILRVYLVLLFRLVWIPMSLFIFVKLFDVTIPIVVAVMFLVTALSVINSFYATKASLLNVKEAILR